MADQRTNDVVVLGGGLAGLTLALQLKRQRPETSVVVLDKREAAAPEAAFKVGESTVPAGAHYLAEIVGMREHLEEFHLKKCGLRYFLPHGDNSDLTKRIELGPDAFPPHDNFQIDRGRFENELTHRVQAAGVDLRQGASITDVRVGGDVHSVDFTQKGGEPETVDARWLVGASGRAGILRRKLGIGREVGHTINASWFRLRNGLDIEQWGADNAEWLSRMRQVGLRQYSTNHLMGEGYWVWLIPLGSGFISIGACTDPRVHPYEELRTLEGLFDWFDRWEPQLGAAVRPRIGEVEDFLTLEDFAYGVERIYSPDRWTLVGEAGVFADPFYSPGSDLIGTSNIFTCDLVEHDLAGEDVTERVEFYNDFHLRTFQSVLARTENQYLLMGHHRVILPKLSWDAVLNHYGTTFVIVQNRLGDYEFLKSVRADIEQIYTLNIRMQQLFLDWHRLDRTEWTEEIGQIPPARVLIEALVAIIQPHDDDGLRGHLKRQLKTSEAMAVQIFHKAAETLPTQPDPGRAINPYAVGLEPESWEADGLYDEPGLTLEAAVEITGPLQAFFVDTAAFAPPPGPPPGMAGRPPAGVGAGGPPPGVPAGGPPPGIPAGGPPR
jgi:2-polyprenyl-6-methoxyphenol hydroxylase-like FAD-dependent oxidoreductase